MKCTAPVRGHRLPDAWSRCASCKRGTYWPPPAGVVDLPTRVLSADRWREVQAIVIEAGLDVAVSRDIVGSLVGTASDLVTAPEARANIDHWLCELLAEAADALESTTVSSVAADVLTDALEGAGLPFWAARMAASGISRALVASLLASDPASQVRLALRVLALLLCPDADKCPVGDDVARKVVSTVVEDPGTSSAGS